jgi:dipeptidyl aminopeptidase/acylaminoacyl peptidase
METKDYIRKSISFPSAGSLLDAWLYLPAAAATTQQQPPIVLMGHGKL